MAKLLTKQEKKQFLLDNEDFKNFHYDSEKVTKYDIVILNSGEYLRIDTPSIESTMYYPDHMDAPSTAEKSFINYNLWNSMFAKVDKWVEDIEDAKKSQCCSGALMLTAGISKQNHYCSLNGEKWYALYAPYDDQEKYNNLSEEENNEFIEILNTLKENYIKRLKTYYKRYKNNIYTYGYWADR